MPLTTQQLFDIVEKVRVAKSPSKSEKTPYEEVSTLAKALKLDFAQSKKVSPVSKKRASKLWGQVIRTLLTTQDQRSADVVMCLISFFNKKNSRLYTVITRSREDYELSTLSLGKKLDLLKILADEESINIGLLAAISADLSKDWPNEILGAA